MIHFRGNDLRTPTLLIRGEYQASEVYSGFYVYRGVAQLVARTAGGREVASSSLVTPTIQKEYKIHE
ncbi:MAG: hypothetical protein JWP06_1235 [Candidatus Saccharibacteria bacterium]|nr:hypothetical protein [Candidatus Saccharibacteria bacterium]